MTSWPDGAGREHHVFSALHNRLVAATGRKEWSFVDPAFKAAQNALKTWPLPNVHIGVSVEDQTRADERIPLLLETPAAVRWISAEPLLGPIDLEDIAAPTKIWPNHDLEKIIGKPVECLRHRDALRGIIGWVGQRLRPSECPDETDLPKLDHVIVGGESGPNARPFDLAWARSIVSQCRAAGVPVFVKQIGALPVQSSGTLQTRYPASRSGGDPEEWPEWLRVREYPVTAIL